MNREVSAWLFTPEGKAWSRAMTCSPQEPHWLNGYRPPPSTMFQAAGLDAAYDPCGAPPVGTVTR